MQNNLLNLPATITGVSTKADGSLSIRIGTQELTNEAKVGVMEFVNKFGYMTFSESLLQKIPDPPQTLDLEPNLTPSKRLRAVLFVLYKQRELKEDFETFYMKQINSIIEKYKEMLT